MFEHYTVVITFMYRVRRLHVLRVKNAQPTQPCPQRQPCWNYVEFELSAQLKGELDPLDTSSLIATTAATTPATAWNAEAAMSNMLNAAMSHHRRPRVDAGWVRRVSQIHM